jgi:hypothetical protein
MRHTFDNEMKIIALLTMCSLLAGGCRTHSPSTEVTLSQGEYSVDVPHITEIIGTTNNPTIVIHECGKLQVRINSFEGTRKGDIWIDWIDGTVTDETTNDRDVDRDGSPPLGGSPHTTNRTDRVVSGSAVIDRKSPAGLPLPSE